MSSDHNPSGRRLRRLMHGWLPSGGAQRGTQRAVGWQSLPQPVPGHSTIDGVPVPVVVVRRNGATGQLEVVRGHHPTAEWPGAATPAGAKRHVLPALSFIPHPRRELMIGGQRFFFGTVSASVRCAACGSDDNGFGFVGAGTPPAGAAPGDADGSTLCETCADERAQVAAR